MHRKVDVVVDIPAFVGVLLTGAMLLEAAPGTATLNLQIRVGLIAILANAYCAHAVFRRASCSECNDWEGFETREYLQHKEGSVVLLGVLKALGTGICLA
ncbi:MAG: hypothetical protein KDI01_06645 [Halioglobus sp.]|nr:hypothetical protein [Halioglobus sp.]